MPACFACAATQGYMEAYFAPTLMRVYGCRACVDSGMLNVMWRWMQGIPLLPVHGTIVRAWKITT